MNQRIFGVTGATGFIGCHLINSLLAKSSHTVALVRHPENYRVQGVQVRRADIFDPESLSNALQGVDTVYYLVHSMKSKGREFARMDLEGAKNFLDAAESSGVRRIIYLGGLGETGSGLSEHLKSRAEVGRILQSGRIPTTVLRAAIIIGAGSASWEMLRQLVERLPIMTTPKWVETKCQPISLRDVLKYLVACGDVGATVGETFDIGGPDILTYRQMMMKVAELLGKRVRIYGIPILSPRLSSYWVDLVTDVPSNVARPLIEGLRNEVTCRDDKIKALIPIDLTSFPKAVELAIHGTV
ncbi:MAG TPA: NAD(P)H-binding protein [Candidatus Dormibacteraeota bacterium]|nr:NAD(P)H-binding protein [Candidatus Dormibacteraeota bacterium]